MSLYHHPDLYDALLPADPRCVSFYRELAIRQKGAVLELACGTGSLAVPIADAGIATMGMDIAPEMLEAAARRSGAVEWRQGDMRSFALERKFALIFIARNSLLHLAAQEEFTALFGCVRQHLAPGGIFAFDIFNPDVRLLARPAGERFPAMRAGDLTVEEVFDYDAAAQVNRITWFITSTGRPDALKVPLHLRNVFPQELPLIIEKGGFRLQSRFGDYDRAPFASRSPRQVCICR